jgi:hypothetical protein
MGPGSCQCLWMAEPELQQRERKSIVPVWTQAVTNGDRAGEAQHLLGRFEVDFAARSVVWRTNLATSAGTGPIGMTGHTVLAALGCDHPEVVCYPARPDL